MRLLITKEASQGYSARCRLRRLNRPRPQDAAFARKADVRFFRNQLLSVVDFIEILGYIINSFSGNQKGEGNLHIKYQLLDVDTVMVIAYDVDEDPDNELCAVFLGEETEQKVQLLERHRRGASKETRQNCEDFKNLDKLTQAVFELLMPRLYAAAMHALNYKDIDDDLPPQLELPK